MIEIIFVCTGNTCRSPMAEKYFNTAAEKKRLSEYAASSAGIAASEGMPISEDAAAVLTSNNINSAHTSKQLTDVDVERAGLIYAVTHAHAKLLKSIYPNHIKKIHAAPFDITDPFGGSPEVYEKCFLCIKKTVDIIIDRLITGADL